MAFQVRCERSLLLSSRAFWPNPEQCSKPEDLQKLAKRLQQEQVGVPRCGNSSEFAFRPGCGEASLGVDPYHTPENEKIRRQLHVALGAKIAEDRKFLHVSANPYSLSPATSQIPFAGFNDPRRLRNGAKAQVQAVSLSKPETPLITTKHHQELDPPGVNLRVGYIAWAGWNHEDAWVVSESASRKLESRSTMTRDLPISSLEYKPTFIQAGPVASGAALVERRISPAYLWPHFDKLAAVLNVLSEQQFATFLKDGTLPLQGSPEDRLNRKGTQTLEVQGVEITDLVRKQVIDVRSLEPVRSLDANEISLEALLKHRDVARVRIVETRPLQPGDKLASRHGHKGIVGLILPDERMPLWNEKPLEAMIDPISVLNRGNWGQLYETLAGAIANRQGGNPLVDSGCETADWLTKFCEAYGADENGRSIITASVNSRWLQTDSGSRVSSERLQVTSS